ncbi:hypothetical protein [Streptomyces sp. NPDC047028]|uniref:hypothetical protein n=1 Tax=Streptomyces sp. NPDC047028 TaxID=3155793 RepID=UPI0033D7AF23
MTLAVRMSAEVEQALGPQMAVQARSITEGTCIECQQPLDSGPVNVVLGMGPGGAGGIWFVHDRCAPSRIIELNPEAEAALVQPEDGLDMTMAAGIVEGTPVLVARMVMTPFTDSGTYGAEPRNVFMQALLQYGFQLVTAELDAGPLAEWVAVFQPHGRDLQLVVLTPAGERFYQGTLPRPPAGWVRAVLDGRQVLLLGGDVAGSHDAPEVEQAAALAVAASEGKLAGARVAAGRPGDFGLS